MTRSRGVRLPDNTSPSAGLHSIGQARSVPIYRQCVQNRSSKGCLRTFCRAQACAEKYLPLPLVGHSFSRHYNPWGETTVARPPLPKGGTAS